MDAENVCWLDQMSINCGMTRLYGRAFKNERINDYVPDVRFERTSVMGALGVDGMIAPLAYKGTLNGEFFGVYVKEFLAPAMKKGDTLILDNLSPHKVKDILKPLTDKGVKVVFLHVYPPDFSPAELAWSKIKTFLRKIKAKTFDDLFYALGKAIDTIVHSDIAGWINHCGYKL